MQYRIPWVRMGCSLDIRGIPDKNLLVGCLGIHCGGLKKAYSAGIFVGVEVGVFEVPVIDYQAWFEARATADCNGKRCPPGKQNWLDFLGEGSPNGS